MLHPLTALEHVLPIVVLALLAGQQGAATARRVMVALPAGLSLGALAAFAYSGSSAVGPVNLGSFVVLGGLVALSRPLPPLAVPALALGFGVTHGYANGAALVPGMSHGLFLGGLITAGVVASTLIAAAVVSLRPAWCLIAVRVVGAWIAAIGLLMTALTLRAGG